MTAAVPALSFTFRIAPEARGFFTHRSPVSWLDDLARFQGVTLHTAEADDDPWAPTVFGDESALRFACVAFNLHAEQTPWDSTPVEQAEALERVLAGGTPRDEEIVVGLRAAGLRAEHAYTPSRISITLDRQHEEEPTREVLLTTGHNVDGWEAVLDVEGSQAGLEDGPAASASVAEVVAWVQRLQAEGWKEF